MRACVHVNAQPLTQTSHLLALPQPYITVAHMLTRACMYRYRARGTHGRRLGVFGGTEYAQDLQNHELHTRPHTHRSTLRQTSYEFECRWVSGWRFAAGCPFRRVITLFPSMSPGDTTVTFHLSQTPEDGKKRWRGRQTVGENEKGMKNE